MTAVRNHVAVPFFDRVPQRAKGIVLKTFDSIVDRSTPQRQAYHSFSTALKEQNIEGPTSEEFANWYNRVANGLIDRPHPSEVVSFAQVANPRWTPARVATARPSHARLNPCSVACDVDQTAVEADRLNNAKAIVLAAHALFEAKIAGGYSPLSIALDDTIVAEALKEVIEADATAQIMGGDGMMTPGNMVVDLLLGADDADIDAKLVDILTMDMQQELCCVLIQSGLVERGLRDRAVSLGHASENLTN